MFVLHRANKKSLKVRLNKHCYYARNFKRGGRSDNPDKQNWVFDILKRGERPSIVLIDRCYDQQEADEKEKFWISFCKSMGHPILNKSTGGLCGGTFSLSEEARKKQSEYDLNDNLIAVFNGTMDAVRKTGVSYQAIQSCLWKRANTGYGFKWKFTGEKFK